MKNAARVGDTICHGGTIVCGSSDVTINSQPAAMKAASATACALHGGNVVVTGSDSVFINGYPAARFGDITGCGASICNGSDDVLIG
ncbi:hypothetical protein C9426_28085 [Serratia sp. S1B]|nr:hypothetical protein C9426_28085 [Serratia sp. S1B]